MNFNLKVQNLFLILQIDQDDFLKAFVQINVSVIKYFENDSFIPAHDYHPYKKKIF